MDATLVRHGHDVAATGEPDQGGGHKGQDDAEDDLTGGQGLVEPAAADGAGDDDAGDDADGPRDEPPHPGLDGPAQHALGHHLAGHGAHDARRRARQEQRQGEQGARGGGQVLAQESVDAEEVGVGGGGRGVERGARHDEDGRIDKQGEREERRRELHDRILEAGPDGVDGRAVFLALFVLRDEGDHVAVLLVNLPQPWLDHTRAQEDGVRHDRGSHDSAGQVDPVAFHHRRRGQVALEHLPGRRVSDVGQLDAEAHHDTQYQAHDEVLEETESRHGAVGPVEKEQDEHVDEGDGTSRHERNVQKKIQCDGGTNDLFTTC